jgi:hypothetical protein
MVTIKDMQSYVDRNYPNSKLLTLETSGLYAGLPKYELETDTQRITILFHNRITGTNDITVYSASVESLDYKPSKEEELEEIMELTPDEIEAIFEQEDGSWSK